jgi:hypothetical protein
LLEVFLVEIGEKLWRLRRTNSFSFSSLAGAAVRFPDRFRGFRRHQRNFVSTALKQTIPELRLRASPTYRAEVVEALRGEIVAEARNLKILKIAIGRHKLGARRQPIKALSMELNSGYYRRCGLKLLQPRGKEQDSAKASCPD